jgi:hypothetical protein
VPPPYELTGASGRLYGGYLPTPGNESLARRSAIVGFQMGDLRRAHCLTCGRHRDYAGPISWLGNCATCGELRQAENIVGIATKTGPGYRRWCGGMIRYANALQAERLQQTGS